MSEPEVFDIADELTEVKKASPPRSTITFESSEKTAPVRRKNAGSPLRTKYRASSTYAGRRPTYEYQTVQVRDVRPLAQYYEHRMPPPQVPYDGPGPHKFVSETRGHYLHGGSPIRASLPMPPMAEPMGPPNPSWR